MTAADDARKAKALSDLARSVDQIAKILAALNANVVALGKTLSAAKESNQSQEGKIF